MFKKFSTLACFLLGVSSQVCVIHDSKRVFTPLECRHQFSKLVHYAKNGDMTENHLSEFYVLYKHGLFRHLVLRKVQPVDSQKKQEQIWKNSEAVNSILEIMPCDCHKDIMQTQDPKIYGPVQQKFYSQILLVSKQIDNSLYYIAYPKIRSTRGYN